MIPGHALIHVHRDLMIAATVVSGVLTGLAWWKRDDSPPEDRVCCGRSRVGYFRFVWSRSGRRTGVPLR